jgi:hypothetical protein
MNRWLTLGLTVALAGAALPVRAQTPPTVVEVAASLHAFPTDRALLFDRVTYRPIIASSARYRARCGSGSACDFTSIRMRWKPVSGA